MSNDNFQKNLVVKDATSKIDEQSMENWTDINTKLFKRYKQGDQSAKEALIMYNTRLVKKIASLYFYKAKYDYEDLIQEGYIGLIKAIDKFDESYNIEFSTYAVFWIKQCILN